MVWKTHTTFEQERILTKKESETVIGAYCLGIVLELALITHP